MTKLKTTKTYMLSILFMLLLLTGCFCTACQSSKNEDIQRYAWPLATASPEDTVTQIFAEKFANEVNERSNGLSLIHI